MSPALLRFMGNEAVPRICISQEDDPARRWTRIPDPERTSVLGSCEVGLDCPENLSGDGLLQSSLPTALL